jgi:hypothetical protein
MVPAVVVTMLLLGACGGGGRTTATTGGPATLDASASAQGEASKSSLRTALRAGQTYYSHDGAHSFVGFDAAAAAKIDPSFTWLDGTEPAEEEMSITQADAKFLNLVTRSANGLYYCIQVLNQFGGSDSGLTSGASFADVDTAQECTQSGA